MKDFVFVGLAGYVIGTSALGGVLASYDGPYWLPRGTKGRWDKYKEDLDDRKPMTGLVVSACTTVIGAAIGPLAPPACLLYENLAPTRNPGCK